MVRVGVLALQGDVREHLRALRAAGAEAVEVRAAAGLDAVDGIVLPGGESTTIGTLLDLYGLLEPLRSRIHDGLPAYGSCAGMILLADRVLDGRPDQPLVGGLDIAVRRNAFGRQVDSFEADVAFEGIGEVRGVFIRAPWVEEVGDGVAVLASSAGRIVAVRQRRILATAFHPELTGDVRVHRLFCELIDGGHP